MVQGLARKDAWTWLGTRAVNHTQDCLAAVPTRWYDGAIMMVRTQITLEAELQKRARRRASDTGVSLAEYVRRLVARELGRPEPKADPAFIFDLGSSAGSDVAVEKDSMVAQAFASARRKKKRR